MVDPIDIKTKKIFRESHKNKFDKDLVLDIMENNIISNWDTWGKFQQIWTNQAYNTFKDFDKYLVLIYLIRDFFQQNANKFSYQSYDEFYDFDFLTIDKLNLIKISTELDIPKETVRRKVNELQQGGILKREGKSIILQRKFAGYQKPEQSLDALAALISKKSKYLDGQIWFGETLEKEEVKEYIKKYFTIMWLNFLKLQIPFLLRHRKNFRDLETWIIWGNVALHHQKSLNKIIERSVTTEIDYKNYYKKVSDLHVNRGVNASSIADISGIPRATVIRKLRWLVKNKTILKNKKLEYIMQYKGLLNSKIETTFRFNQVQVAEFLTTFFDYYKNSNLKP